MGFFASTRPHDKITCSKLSVRTVTNVEILRHISTAVVYEVAKSRALRRIKRIRKQWARGENNANNSHYEPDANPIHDSHLAIKAIRMVHGTMISRQLQADILACKQYAK